MRVISLLFLVILSSHIIVAQDAAQKQPPKVEGISLGMTKEEVKAVYQYPTSSRYEERTWLFDSSDVIVSFNDQGIVTEVSIDDAGSKFEFDGFIIECGSSLEVAKNLLGPPTKTMNTEMVSEYFFADPGVVLLTYADDDSIVLIVLTKTYDKE